MALPKKVMKIQKDGITFESNINAIEYTLKELTYSCLKEVLRLLRYRLSSKLYKIHGLGKGKYARQRARNTIQGWARKRDDDLQIGYGNTKHNQSGDSWYGINQELGMPSALNGGKRTSKAQPQRMILRNTVLENRADIDKIANQYFKRLDEDNPRLDDEDTNEYMSGEGDDE